MSIKISVTFKYDKGEWKKIFDKYSARLDKAISATANMIASMQRDQFRSNIATSGGNLGTLADGLTVTVQHAPMYALISTFHDRPYAHVFEDGAQIEGNLLWVPLSNTDARGVRPKEYPGGLFSIKRTATGRPLLFSVSDKQPKYFGIEQVTIPKKWNLHGIQQSIMANFRSVFDDAWKAAA